MVNRTETRNTSIKTPLWICILAGAATGTLVAMITTVSTPAVHADTEVNRPAAIVLPASGQPVSHWKTAPIVAAAASPTPASLAPPKPVPQQPVLPVVAKQQPIPQAPVKAVVVKAEKKHLNIFHGIASWYGGVFNGRKTASGETYDKTALTACHPTLPFGSLVKVINRSNKRSVVVRINDRGDLGDGNRVIDLSWAAAKELAMVQSGVARVDIEVLTMGRDDSAK